MLKQILTTSALVFIGAASIQAAAAADFSRSRQLVVEPAGASAAVKLDPKKLHFLVAPQGGTPAPSNDPIVTANNGNGNDQGPKNIKFIVAPQGGAPAPSNDPIVTGNNDRDPVPHRQQFIVAPQGGNLTPSHDRIEVSDNDQPVRTKIQSIVVNPAPDLDQADAADTAPVDADPAPVDVATAAPADDAAPLDQPAATSDDTDSDAVATDDTSATPSNQVVVSDIHSPGDLYARLSQSGYAVKVVKHDDQGDVVFLVTRSDNSHAGYLLLVDGHYGKVIEKKAIALADYGYARHEETYPVASYGSTDSSYGSSDDNCDYGTPAYRHTASSYDTYR